MYNFNSSDNLDGLTAMCLNKISFWEKVPEQNSHSKGFSPVWVLMWRSNRLLLTNDLGHITQISCENQNHVLISTYKVSEWSRRTRLPTSGPWQGLSAENVTLSL